MKTNKKALGAQRRAMDTMTKTWLPLRAIKPPPTGWLKAIRGALGISARQLAQATAVDVASIIRLEEREPKGKVTLELLNKVANVMDCKLIYAIVPKDEHQSLESVVDRRAKRVAKELINKVEHTMNLENQGSPNDQNDLDELARKLKEKMDPRIWGIIKSKKKKEKPK